MQTNDNLYIENYKTILNKSVLIMDEVDEMSDSLKSELNYPDNSNKESIDYSKFRFVLIYELINNIYYSKGGWERFRNYHIEENLGNNNNRHFILYSTNIHYDIIKNDILNIIKNIFNKDDYDKIDWNEFFVDNISITGELSEKS